jgi:hypothetical protein
MPLDQGQTVLRRDIRPDGTIGTVWTGRVVRDDDRGTLIWQAIGSQVMHRTTLDGAPIRPLSLVERLSAPTMLSPTAWYGSNVLIWTTPAEAYSVWWFFEPDGTFEGWYVNLEAPARRWSDCLDITDHELDMWVEPDRSWSWKDEDELAERVGHPDFWTVTEGDAIRAAGERVVPLIEAGTYPFDGTFTDFTPDPDWQPTILPPRWDLPFPSKSH